MLQMGLHVPNRDATWETEAGAFSYLTERYSNCDQKDCLCPHGRE